MCGNIESSEKRNGDSCFMIHDNEGGAIYENVLRVREGRL